MPKYNDDQCFQCGGIRIAGSTLCAECLVKLCNSSVRKNIDKIGEISQLEGKIKKLTELCEKLLDHITDESIYQNELHQAAYAAWLRKK